MGWVVAFLLALPGFAGLAMSMTKHQRDVFGAPLAPERGRLYKRVGGFFVAVFLIWSMALFRWDFGLVVACGVASIASVIVILTLTLRPRWVQYYCWLPAGFTVRSPQNTTK